MLLSTEQDRAGPGLGGMDLEMHRLGQITEMDMVLMGMNLTRQW